MRLLTFVIDGLSRDIIDPCCLVYDVESISIKEFLLYMDERK